MKTAIRTMVPLAALAVAAKAMPFLSVGDSAELFATGTFGVRSDDNVLLSEKAVSDVVYEATPGLDFTYGAGKESTGHISYKEAFSFYGDNNDLNSSLGTVDLGGVYDDKTTKLTFDASWAQLADNTYDVRYPVLAQPDLITNRYQVRRDAFKVATGGEVFVSERSSIGSGVKYEYTNYKRASFDDSRFTTVPLDYYYQLTPKVDMSLDFRFRHNNLHEGVDSKDFFYGLGSRGQLTEKLHGHFVVGYSQRDYKTGAHANTVGGEAGLEYSLTEKIKLLAGVTNDFAYSGAGESERKLAGNVGFTSKVGEDWTLGATFAYNDINYLGLAPRTDNYFEAAATISYALTPIMSIQGGYTYRNLNSKINVLDFTSNVFSLYTNVRY